MESRLTTEVGQYKLNLERIKREKIKEEEGQKDELIEQANKLLEEFDAEKHLFKAKIKKLLIEYCDLNEDSYHIGDEVDMDEYLEILEKELKVFTDRVKEESLDRISKIMTDLESGIYMIINLFSPAATKFSRVRNREIAERK
jgi:predicted nuclease with TOPRIM domain